MRSYVVPSSCISTISSLRRSPNSILFTGKLTIVGKSLYVENDESGQLGDFKPFEEVIFIGLVLLFCNPIELGDDVFMELVFEERRRRQLGGQEEERRLRHLPV